MNEVRVKYLQYWPISLVFLLLVRFASAAEKPLYDTRADAHQQVASAITEATRSLRDVVIIFGADW